MYSSDRIIMLVTFLLSTLEIYLAPDRDYLIFALAFCDDLTVQPQWHVKHPGHFAKSADGGLFLNTHTPLTPRSWSRLTKLSRYSVEPIREKGSHATRQGTLDYSRLRLLCHCGLDCGVELVCAS